VDLEALSTSLDALKEQKKQGEARDDMTAVEKAKIEARRQALKECAMRDQTEALRNMARPHKGKRKSRAKAFRDLGDSAGSEGEYGSMYSFSSDEDEETCDDDEEYRKPKSKQSKKGKNAAYAGPPRKTLDEIEAEHEAEKRRNEHAHLMDVFTKLEEQRRQYDAEQRRIENEARRQYEARQEATMNAQLQLTQALVNALRPAQPAQSAVRFSPPPP
jgi:hypothetical protein